ncbi:MAG: outer membrane beta-barrel protein [Salinivirgaceae bacterium]
MKHFILIGFSLLILLFNPVFGQKSYDKYNRYFRKDQLSLTLTGTQWLAADAVPRPSVFSRGVNLQMMYPILGNRSNVALALGFGYAVQNYYLDHFLHTNTDDAWFTQIPEDLSYSKYKLTTNYLTLPFELRIRTNPDPQYRRSFKIYPGFRAGFLINVHTKYVGESPDTGEDIKVKEYHIKQISPFSYGPTIRIGYGKLMLHGYYSLTNLFDAVSLNPVNAYEVGLSIVLF